jgi:hypothetical protein
VPEHVRDRADAALGEVLNGLASPDHAAFGEAVLQAAALLDRERRLEGEPVAPRT